MGRVQPAGDPLLSGRVQCRVMQDIMENAGYNISKSPILKVTHTKGLFTRQRSSAGADLLRAHLLGGLDGSIRGPTLGWGARSS